MAATMTQGGEMTYFSFPIEKTETTPDGDIIVKGIASDPRVDSDEQIVDEKFSSKAIADWLATGANVRVQHNSQRDPAGVGIEVETDGNGATWVKSLIIEPVAKRLVEKGVLRAYSVGIARPKIVRDSVARGGRIVDGEIVEISLVDRPANKNCGIQLVKSDKDGHAEWIGKMFGDSDMLTKAEDTVTIDHDGSAVEKSEDTVTVDLPKDVSVSFSPADLAKLLKHREVAEKRQMDPDVGGGVDRDKIPAANFAGRDRSFPIVTPADVSDAASSIGRAGEGNYSSDQLKENITRIARRLGAAFEAELPESWKKDMAGKSESTSEEVDETADKGGKPFGGKPAKPFGGNGDDDTDTGSDTDDDDDDEPDTANKGLKDCKKCGAGYDADAKLRKCEKCGAKLPLANKSEENPAEKSADVACTGCTENLVKGAKFCFNCGIPAESVVKEHKPTPGDGVVGAGASAVKPVPEHREPDGAAIESFESDAHIPTTPDKEVEMKTATRLKSVGAPADMGALHDLTCAAYHLDVAQKSHPTHTFADINLALWQQKALNSAVSAPMDEARKAAQLWQNAVTLKGADPEVVADVRAEAYKSFQDANPGPGSFPSPTELSPGKFRRPYVSEGHASPSTNHQGPVTAHVPTGHLAGGQFDRGPLTSGHGDPSPSNKNTVIIDPAPIPPGMSRTYYRNAEREAARSAMASLHDHIAQTFPDLCAMDGPGKGGQPPTGERPVPLPVGAAKSEDAPVVEKSDKKLRKELEKAVLNGEITVDEARTKLGMEPLAVKTADGPTVTKAFGEASPDLVKSAVAEATEDLVKQLTELKAVVDALSDLPDPREAPFRGLAQQNNVMASKSVAGLPVGARSVAESAEQAQRALLDAMMIEARGNSDPAQREAAWAQVYKMSGIPTLNK